MLLFFWRKRKVTKRKQPAYFASREMPRAAVILDGLLFSVAAGILCLSTKISVEVIDMRNFFLMTVAILFAVQSFCSAAVAVESAKFNDSETLIYPIVRTGNEQVDEKINAGIVGELKSFFKGCHYAVQYDGHEIGGMYTNFEVPCNRAGNTVILSIIITESVYYKGAAHPATYKHALNFNAETGNKINHGYLTDVGDGSNPHFSLDNISKKLREHCQREGIHLFEEALPLKNLPETFYFDENLHVHFIFPQDEIAPYAAGIIDLDMDA